MNKYGLIGFPLGHSFSKKYFSEKFETEKIDANYNLYELTDISQFTTLKDDSTLCGLNVTIPYKEKIIPFLDEVDATAARIGAVNVIKFIRSGNKLLLKGYNSDAVGFEESIKPLLKPHHTKALILGTGGASKAIEFVMNKLNIQTVFVSRNPTSGMISYAELDAETIKDYTIIINATPVGTFPHIDAYPDIPYQFLSSEHLVFDVVYNPAKTLFLKKSEQRGAIILNGEKMLELQAEAAWKIWNA